MQKTQCTLEFRDGRPIAKEVNSLGDEPSPYFHKKKEAWRQAESKRREFEIDLKLHLYLILSIAEPDENGFTVTYKPIGTRFTATIENNLVTKIELV